MGVYSCKLDSPESENDQVAISLNYNRGHSDSLKYKEILNQFPKDVCFMGDL